MNEEQLKKILQGGVSKTPSGNFNHRVLSGLLLKRKNKRNYFLSFDEPLLIAITILGLFLSSVSLIDRNQLRLHSNFISINIYITILLCAFIPVFVIAMNLITKKIMLQK
jgi:capsule polysaccharide modification protein KpsS